MVQISDFADEVSPQEQAHFYLRDCQYELAIAIYQNAIAQLSEYSNQDQSELKINIYRNYAYLGIALLLQGSEQEAQLAWLYAVNDLIEPETERFVLELVTALTAEAKHQETIGNWSKAWLLCRYNCENVPNLENWLCSLQASLQAVATSSEEHLDLDWEALTQSIELLTEQKFAISQELSLSLFEILSQLRNLYPDADNNFSAETCYFLALLYRRELKIYEAIAEFQRAANLAPERLEIYEGLIESLEILVISGSQTVYSDWRQVTEIYVDICHKLAELSSQPSDRFHLSSATAESKVT